MGFNSPSSIEFEMSGWMRTDLRVVVRRLLLVGLLVVVYLGHDLKKDIELTSHFSIN